MKRRKLLPEEKRQRGRIAVFLLSSTVFASALILYAASTWIAENFGVDLPEVLFTLTSPLKGADMGVVTDCVRDCWWEILLILVYFIVGLEFLFLQGCGAMTLRVRLFRVRVSVRISALRRFTALLSAAALAFSLAAADQALGIVSYLEYRRQSTTIYEDYYVSPDSVAITGQGKNLIYLYLESMENSYASESVGGLQPEINYIPLLTELAQENLSFSNSSKLGGFRPIYGATFTMGALFATTTGLPYSFPVDQNAMGNHTIFASGVTALGDILEARGYQNEFLCGSSSSYGGRAAYFQQHGSYTVFDLFTARRTGYIAPDYNNGFWGFEDMYLYQIAKDEILRLAESGQPFNFAMLTVDTHRPDGYTCALCQADYPTKGENAAACADRQAAEFLQWCQEQDFYEDTVIIVTGDHPKMSGSVVGDLDLHERTVYNLFLNCDLPVRRTTNREYTALDIFPTVLAAMGFEIEGDRLGLGANLFSNEPTLLELWDYDELYAELMKYSSYYEENFL